MKCICCGKNVRTTSDERNCFRSMGLYTPMYYVRDQGLDKTVAVEAGLDPNDTDHFMCWDCYNNLMSKQAEKHKADYDGPIVLKLKNYKESRKRLIENPLNEKPDLEDVYNFAKAKHDATGAIRRNSGQPYWVHPSMVADICLAYGGTDEEIALALLHDTAEDTDTSYEEVAARYGERVAELLSEITNEPSEVKRLGKENYINHELMELGHSALFVKLCDMYANSLDHPSEGQAERMKRNLEHLIEFRGGELTDKERRLIKAFPLMDEYDLDVSEFEDSYDEYSEGNYLFASREMPKNRITEKLD